MSVPYKHSIKLKMLLSLLFLFVAVGAIFVAVSYSGERSRQKQTLAEKVETSYNIFLSHIDSDREALTKTLAGVVRVDEFLRLLSLKEKDKLLAAAKPLFDELKAKFRVTHLYFIDPDGKVLLRVHKPEQAGDTLARITYKEAKQTGKVASGIEMGKNFFSLRVIQPVVYNGAPAGYVELGQEIDHVFERFKKLTKNEATILLTNDYIKAKKAELKGAAIGNFTLLDASDKQQAEEVGSQADLAKGLSGFTVSEVKTPKGNYMVGIGPFRDAAGEVAGVLMVQMDTSAMISAAQQSFLVNMLIFIAIFVAATLALVWYFNRTFVTPVVTISEQVERIGRGDLTAAVESGEHDKSEIGQVQRALLTMRNNLSAIMSAVKETGNSVHNASREIAMGNADLSQRTEQQVSALDEVASSMATLTSTVRQNAENAKQANQLAAGASVVASRGGQVVGQVVETMSSINESSRKIVDIISVIDGIAFQTNILALNAAVEAARAGELGRGFAVVAAEVRNLAQRSAAAAKEIKVLISNSVGKVEDGSKQVEQAGQTMEEIVASIKRVTDIMAEISAASLEQSSGIERVSQAISQMEGGAQQNATLVEEAAAATRGLEEQAESLAESVSRFRLAADGGRARPAAMPAGRIPAKVAAVRPVPSAERTVAKAPVIGRKGEGEDEWKEF